MMNINTFRVNDDILAFENKSVFQGDEFGSGTLFVTTDRRTLSANIPATGENRISIDPIEKVQNIRAEVLTTSGKKYVDKYVMDKGEWRHTIDLNTNLDFNLHSYEPIN